MIKTTRAQRVALKRVFDRGPIRVLTVDGDEVTLTYHQFRKRVHPGWDCIMVKWCNMWLGIEHDGYTHS